MWLQSLFERRAVEHSARTAVAATASLLVARVFKLPEAFWAAISTLIVMQSSFGAALTVSVRRFAGTALGAAVGALLATHFGPNVLAFGAGIFLTGLIVWRLVAPNALTNILTEPPTSTQGSR